MKRQQNTAKWQPEDYHCDPNCLVITEEDEAAIEKLLASNESPDGLERSSRVQKPPPA
jgi:hypothetical protein